MGSPPGQHLEDTCVALVSSPPPGRPLQSSHQAGSAPQQHVVEVGDPLLEAGPGVGPLGPRPSAPVPTSHLRLPPHSPDPSGLGSARPLPLGSLLGFPPEETRLLLWDSTELYSFFSQDACFLQCLFRSLSGLGEELRLPRLGIPRPALWLTHSRCSGGNSHLPTQPPVLPRPRPPQHQQHRGGCLGLRKPRKGAPLLPAPSGAGDLQSRCRALGFS